MKLLKQFIKNFILRSDMFAAQTTVRFNGESSYQTIFGGCFSILMVAAFIAIFATQFINVIQKVDVTASLNLQNNPYDQNQITGIKFAIGIDSLDFSNAQRYFHIILKLSTQVGTSSTQQQIPLVSCQSEDWQEQGDNFDKLFSVYNMSKMLCPSPSSNLTLNGFAGSTTWTTMNILVQQCRNMSNVDWTCYPPSDIFSKFASQLVSRDFFKVSILILNTVISPQQQPPTKKVLQNQLFITFSNTSGSRCQVKLGRYQITTDESIWPTTNQTTQQGYYITSHDTYSINLYSTHYVRIQIQKAKTIFQVERIHQKLDQMLSYVGGLFALLFGWIFFFLGSYNQYKYQIAVAQHTFAIDGTGRKIKEDDFGFFTYLKYTLFDWMKTFGLCISWKRMEQIDNARQQANQQMDIKYLMKKIQRFQAINRFLIGQHNLICANLSRPPTLQQVKRMRKIAEYYDKVIKTQNQQKLLAKILNIGEFNKKVMDDSVDKKNEQIQLDSQDQQIQKEIAQIYKQQAAKMNQNELTGKIMREIPQSIKDRLSNLKFSENSQNQILKQKIKIQSNFSIGEVAPKFFSPSIMQKSSYS